MRSSRKAVERYYSDKLSADRLRRCYEIAPPRVCQYLENETGYVLSKTKSSDAVLELGCGYGRVMKKLCSKAGIVTGVDTSLASLRLVRTELADLSNYRLYQMDAVCTGFRENVFDVTVCLQNGISAFKVKQLDLIKEAVRVTRPGGTVLFSTYSDKFWKERLEWFQHQSDEGLLGEIDTDKTGDGVIVCKDGFKATTVSGRQFLSMTSRLKLAAEIVEIDDSSLFCEITVAN